MHRPELKSSLKSKYLGGHQHTLRRWDCKFENEGTSRIFSLNVSKSVRVTKQHGFSSCNNLQRSDCLLTRLAGPLCFKFPSHHLVYTECTQCTPWRVTALCTLLTGAQASVRRCPLTPGLLGALSPNLSECCPWYTQSSAQPAWRDAQMPNYWSLCCLHYFIAIPWSLTPFVKGFLFSLNGNEECLVTFNLTLKLFRLPQG